MPRHSETRHLPYSPEQMFDLVADVARYDEFLPWVTAIRVRTSSETEMVADMIVGFKGLRGASSDRFLDHARTLVEAEGGRIVHTDVTIICEAPKIGPHRDAIRARIADLLRLPLARVSVKATTTERLGFTGREEGIAAQAVATVSLPGSI